MASPAKKLIGNPMLIFIHAVIIANMRNKKIILEYFMFKVLFFSRFFKIKNAQINITMSKITDIMSKKTTPLKNKLIKYTILKADSLKKFSEQTFFIDFIKSISTPYTSSLKLSPISLLNNL